MRRCRSILCCSLWLAVAGCISPVPHEWEVRGTDLVVQVPTKSWQQLPPERYKRVDPAAQETAIGFLGESAFHPIDPEELKAFCGDFSPPENPSLKPYLVRGVAYGGSPDYTIVRYDEKTGQLLVFQATYDGENLLTAAAVRRSRSAPLVVFLPKEPTAVYPTAAVGGDRILRGRDFRELDRR